jgi:glycosyltransferase involved in cell wall biosynthesis
MRIIFWVRAGNKFGGVEKYISLFAEQCQKRGHSFLLLNEIENTSDEYQDRLSKAGAQQIVIGEAIANPIIVFNRARKVIKSWKPDVVQLHLTTLTSVPFLKMWSVPCIYPTYNSGLPFPGRPTTYLLGFIISRLATRVICISERMRRDVLRLGVQKQKIQVVYRGIPISDYLSEATKISDPIPPGFDQADIKKIITVSRFFKVKGVQYVVEAAVDVLRENPGIIWWLVGREGTESDFCKRLVSENHLEDRIFFLGQRNDVPALMSRAWLQVVGSLSEGLGVMAWESSAFGVPTIGTQIGGLDEAIIDGATGVLVEPGSYKALAKATKYLLSNPDLRDKLGKAAREYVCAKFDSINLISDLLDIFEADYQKYLKRID